MSRDPKIRLELRERPDIGVYVKDLSSFVTKSVEEIEHVMSVGRANRTVGFVLHFLLFFLFFSFSFGLFGYRLTKIDYLFCEYVDEVENFARKRLCKLFNVRFANVQPHSGQISIIKMFNFQENKHERTQ